MKTIPKSSFFKERRAPTLPTPAGVRAINKKLGDTIKISFNRPPPVMIPSLNLAVKYGADVTTVEAQTQRMVYERLQGKFPVPEDFGWTEDGGQERWGGMDENESLSVCQELQHMVKTWRDLKQDSHDRYIGSLGKQPLNEIFLVGRPEIAGPFEGVNAVQQFQDACGIEISGQAAPTVFTHADLVPPNILLSSGQNPKIAAVLDWAQAGWYPAYWEYCKARRVRLNPERFSDTLQEEWHTKYLPMILEPMDNETCYYPWLYFVLSKGV